MSDKDLVHKTKDAYDGSFTTDILEQYKIYVQSAENVSSRRIATSRYLLTLSAALLAIYGIQILDLTQNYWTLTIPTTGIIISILWYCLIKSYRNLNAIKFQIIHDLEQYLPVALYKYEWKKAGQGNGKFYTEVTQIEQWIPIIFTCVHIIFAVILVLVNMAIL